MKSKYVSLSWLGILCKADDCLSVGLTLPFVLTWSKVVHISNTALPKLDTPWSLHGETELAKILVWMQGICMKNITGCVSVSVVE